LLAASVAWVGAISAMRILRYTARRFLIAVPQMLFISLVTFILIRMLPGDPARLELGPLSSQEAVDRRRSQLRLDVCLELRQDDVVTRVPLGAGTVFAQSEMNKMTNL
jgi:peptide/nickel transport system permease protein